MTDNFKTQQLIEEMRSKGNLPAINENVQAITQITHQSHTRAVDLATVIMRDCGLTSNILATANSVIYRPRYPIKTVTYAVTFLGFEKIRSLALGDSPCSIRQ
ncbi:MAG: HDOD domain-containing protein [Deltaproteobacteria bacterium]|jgi:HD-like signal output (HDOD) protein|nr:HDOD domain-containing protein [Deltaproteobacteria bacterium]